MVQSWKGCVPKGTGGSNPPLSVHSNNKTYGFIIRMNFSFFIENEKTKR